MIRYTSVRSTPRASQPQQPLRSKTSQVSNPDPIFVRHKIHEGLNVVENWNSANKDIFYGKAGDLTGDDREHVEVSALALHLVQATIAYLNTHLIQIILREDPKLRARLTPEDLRGLSALFWTHLNLYGRLELDMTNHLDLSLAN